MRFYPDDGKEYLPLIHGQRLPYFNALFPTPPHLILYPSIYVFFVYVCVHVFNHVIFATSHHVKQGKTTRIAMVHLSLLITGEAVE